VPGFKQPALWLLSRRDQGTALLVFFSFQPLVEHAVQHGLHSSPGAGRLQLVVRPTGSWLEMSVIDDGQGVPSAEIEQLFFGERPRAHARQRAQSVHESLRNPHGLVCRASNNLIDYLVTLY